jgi:hypothetical protein
MRSNLTLTTGCSLAAGGGSGGWACTSTRTLKENYVPVDGEELLAKIRTIPLNRWTWIEAPEGRTHMGPFAEDFYAAFGLGTDSMAIGHQDIDGVNMAGVKALEARTTQLREEIEILTGAVAALRREQAELATRAESRDGQYEALLRAVQLLTERVRTLEPSASP